MRAFSILTFWLGWLAFVALAGKAFANGGGVPPAGELLLMQAVFVANWTLNGFVMPLYVMLRPGPMRAEYRFWLGGKIVVLGGIAAWTAINDHIYQDEFSAWLQVFGGMCGLASLALYVLDFLPGWGRADAAESDFAAKLAAGG